MTAYGQVVPISRDLISRFQVINDMLENDKLTSGAKVETNTVVPMEMEPVVVKESIALAVHFVTHFVSQEVHALCAQIEEGRREELAGGPSATWSPDFDRFYTIYILQRYRNYHRFHVLCELMALACFLNCPSLKHFVRTALVLWENAEQPSGEEM